jgi:hypothetical protein
VKHIGFWTTDKQGKHQGIDDISITKNSLILDPNCTQTFI